MVVYVGNGRGDDKVAEWDNKRFNSNSVFGVIGMDTSTTTLLTKKYIQYYHILRDEVKHKTGKYPNEYRDDIDQSSIEEFFKDFREENKTIKEISVEILSKLISLQALPNMNHRTTFQLVGVYLLSKDVELYEYEDQKWTYDRFAEESKHVILSERSLLKQMGGADKETEKWIAENVLGEHLRLTAEYFDKLIQSGNPVEIPRSRLKDAFSNGDSPCPSKNRSYSSFVM